MATVEVKVWDVDRFSECKTLKEILLNRKELITSFVFLDKGLRITLKTENGIDRIPSPNKGQAYRVLDMDDRAPLDPNNRKATLHIQYLSGNQQFTYLHERFEDIHAPSEVYSHISIFRGGFPEPKH